MGGKKRSKIMRGLVVFIGIMAVLLVVLYLSGSDLPSDAASGEEIIYAEGYDAAITAAARRLEDLRAAQPLPALSVSVGIDGNLVWSRAFGFADMNNRVPAGIHTQFRIGSVSKSVTSLAVALLHETGELDLDQPIRDYVRGLPQETGGITARQLGGHLGGIRHYRWSLSHFPPHETYSRRSYASVDEALAIFKDDPLLFTPGSGFEYSTYGYTLLSAVLEAAARQDILGLMQERVFEVLEMHDTGPDLTAKAAPPDFESAVAPSPDHEPEYTPSPHPEAATGPAPFYLQLFGRLYPAPAVDISYKWAGGGFLSTPTDLVKMGNALLCFCFVDSTTVDLLFTPQRLSNGEVNPQNYGIGWRSGRVKYEDFAGGDRSYDVVHHGGSIVGGSAFLLLFPKARLTVAMTTNINPSNRGEFRGAAYAVAREFLLKLAEKS